MRWFTGVLAASLLAACAGPRAPSASLPPASPLVGKPAEIAALDLRGNEVSVSADAGKVRVVDFFATWCDPCRAQLPALDRLARTYGPRGLAVYAVSFDGDPAVVNAFLQEVPVAIPVLWDANGERLAAPLGLNRLPTTLVLDRGGVVRYVHRGYGAGSDERLEREVTELLEE